MESRINIPEKYKNIGTQSFVIKTYKINEKLSNFKLIYYKQIILNDSNYVLSLNIPKDKYNILENNDIVFIQSIH